MFCRFDPAEHWARRALAVAPMHTTQRPDGGRCGCSASSRHSPATIDVGLEHSRAAVDERPCRRPPLGARQRHARHEPPRRRSNRRALTRRRRRRRSITTRGFETSFGTLPRRRRRPVPRAPRPVGRGRQRPRRRGGAGIDSRSARSNSTPQCAAGRSSRTARGGRRPSPNGSVVIPLMHSATPSIERARRRAPRGEAVGRADRRSLERAEPEAPTRVSASRTRFTAGPRHRHRRARPSTASLARRPSTSTPSSSISDRRIDDARADPGSASPDRGADSRSPGR